jgi:hypothetical protein
MSLLRPMLERFARSWFPLAFLCFGSAIIVVASVSYFELPYPDADAPLELKKNFQRNQALGNRMVLWGASCGAVGLCLLALQPATRLSLSLTHRTRPGD